MIPYGRQDITEDDIAAVVEVLRSDYLTQGPMVPRFEAAVATQVGATHAVAVNSATSALHIACLALGLGAGDWLWTSPITFVASANCGLYCGAQVDFVDIDSRTLNLCPVKLEQKLIEARRAERLPSVVVAVHMCGEPCDMEAIHRLSKEYGFRIIEDASHAIGSRCNGRWVGDSSYSDITVFSFHPVKIVTTAEGGVATTEDRHLAEKMMRLRSHGITRDVSQLTVPVPGPWYYEQQELGFNYRMTDLQAALGVSQMSRLMEYLERRHQLAAQYDTLLEKLPVQLPYRHPDNYSALHLYIIRLDSACTAVRHAQVFEELRNEGVGVNLHYIPVHTQPYYRELGFCYGDFPEAERYYGEAITLPLYPLMTDREQQSVAAALEKVLEI